MNAGSSSMHYSKNQCQSLETTRFNSAIPRDPQRIVVVQETDDVGKSNFRIMKMKTKSPTWKMCGSCLKLGSLPTMLKSKEKLYTPSLLPLPKNGRRYGVNFTKMGRRHGLMGANIKKVAWKSNFYKNISYIEVLNKNLRVMDSTAISLAKESKIPIIVTNLNTKNSMLNAIRGKGKFSIIS